MYYGKRGTDISGMNLIDFTSMNSSALLYAYGNLLFTNNVLHGPGEAHTSASTASIFLGFWHLGDIMPSNYVPHEIMPLPL